MNSIYFMSDRPVYNHEQSQAKGLHITLNGYIVSIQGGRHNYIDPELREKHGPLPEEVPRTLVEVAIWPKGGDFLLALTKDDQVAGFVPIEQVCQFLGWLATQLNVTDEQILSAWTDFTAKE